MMRRSQKLNQKGYTLIELAIATAIMAVMATTVILANRFLNRQSVQNADQTFATEKSIQMYEELRALVNGNEQTGVAVLDQYSDGSSYNLVLTTDPKVNTKLSSANPGDPLSGNIKTDGFWRYMRQITVSRLANDPYARQVTIKMYLYPGDYAANNQTKPGSGIGGVGLLATVGGILRTSTVTFQPSQVLDVYVLQVNNIPAWWAVMPTLSAAMQSVITDMQTRNTGLVLRTHYVTRTSYGRDGQYQPSTNSTSNTPDSSPVSWVYFYPGYVTQDSTSSVSKNFYYDPDDDQNSLRMDGNVMVDNVSQPVSVSQFNAGTGTTGIAPSYAVADKYNNAMRYPDELAAYSAVTAAAAAASQQGVTVTEGVTEISERMLIESLLSNPATFANSIIINLHGELLPLPPMRNYSDAAKDPGDQLGNVTVPSAQVTCAIAPYANNINGGDTNVRVVTHPELLYYPSQSGASAVTIRLRVYAYYDGENDNLVFPTGDPRVPGISLFFPDAAVTLVGVTAEIGNGFTSGTTAVSYARVALSSPFGFPYNATVGGDTAAAGGPMSLTASYVGAGSKQTLITLFNTPLRAASGAVSGGSGSTTVGGLKSGDILYGSEYIPCSPDITSAPTSATYVNNSYSFTGEDLASPDTNTAGQPCNTARWILSLAVPITQVYSTGVTTFNSASSLPSTFIGMHTIETYMGKGVTTTPSYTVGGNTTTITPDLSRTYVWTGPYAPPSTEQYQFLGDPRDCPYLDVKVGSPILAGMAVTIGPNAYNWWFKNGTTGAGSISGAGYAGFGASAGVSCWNGGGGNVNIDLPRYYQIIRQGLLGTGSIWATTNGWSFYYYGLGGEIGFDQNPMSGGISIKSYPFQKTTAGAAVLGYDSINGDGAKGSPIVGEWVAAAVTSTSKWYQRSWLGEIYPDSSYLNSWVTYGNLPSCINGTTPSLGQTFYLQSLQSVGVGGTEPANEGFAGVTFFPNPGPYGCSSFFNGVSGGTTMFCQSGTSLAGTEQSLSVTTYGIFQYALPFNVTVQRIMFFQSGLTGNVPEFGIAPYSSATTMRTSLSIPSTLTNNASATSRIFYNTATTGDYGSALIRMTVPNSGTTQTGYVIETGTSPSASVGIATLAETDLVYGLRTFLDGGELSAVGSSGHIVQVPLVKIFLASSVPQYVDASAITFTVGSAVTYTQTNGALTIGDPVPNIWWRYSGATTNVANYYTEEYPSYSTGTAGMTATGLYSESVNVVYNLKYSNNAGKNWYYVQDNSAAVTGVCNYNSTYAINTVAPWNYGWNINSTNQPQGDYWLMVEAYRQGYGNHYAFDIQDLEITW